MHGPTGGPRVLILEDEAIIAMEVDGILTDAGFDVAAALSTCAAAMDWLVEDRVDVALIDLDLLDGSSDLVARRLNDLGIPFDRARERARRIATQVLKDVSSECRG